MEDVNDNYPIFGPHRTAISLREDSKAPLVVETFEASDADEGRFGQVVYRLDEEFEQQVAPTTRPGAASSASSVFAIDTIDGRGVLSLIGQLDFEQRPLYQLRILAVDRAGETERLSSATSILVSIEDCEDQPPMFTFAPSITRISEDLPVGSPVLRLAALDGDRGLNNPIKFSLVSVNGHESGPERNLFSMNSDTGQISVARELDREAQPSPSSDRKSLQPGAYLLQVRATEVGSADSFVETELTVILTDVNDELPTFSSSELFGELLENSPAESLVSFIANPLSASSSEPNQMAQGLSSSHLATVIDRDQGTNGSFSLHLEGEHAHLFEVWPREATNEAQLLIKVSSSAYQTSTSRLLDFELTRELHFAVVARERLGPGSEAGLRRSSSVPMTVLLRDANDNYPQFESELYRVEIPENAIRGMHICAVKATDADSGPFGSAGVRYTEIRGERANKFKLDPQTGVITLKTNEHGFDREQVAQHHLIIEARDANGAGNRNTTQLLIVLTDVNDQRPKFLLDQYEAFIFENELDFQTPLQVQAADGDAPNSANSRVTYSIVAGDPQGNFTIDPTSGRIRVRSASSSSSSAQQVAATGRSLDSAIVVVNDQPPGSMPAASQGLDFERIAQKRDDARQFNLTVCATDQGLPEQLSDTTHVIVMVYDRNDHAPVFSRPIYSKSLREDAKEGQQVVQVLAQDGDHSPANSKISYRIASGAGDKFVIDPESGLITVASGANLDIDRAGGGQRRTSYLLNVLAFDGSFGLNQKSASALVNISIVDVNNKAPEFISLGGSLAQPSQLPATLGANRSLQQQQPRPLASTVFVNEDAPYGLIVTRVLAADLDVGAELRYSINWARSEARNEEMALVEPNLFRDVFAIEPLDGTIKVAKQLDRELFDQVKLRLQVEDIAAQTADQVAHSHLVIRIADVNDNRPTFKRPIYKAVVNENSIGGTSVLTMTAEDRDLNKTLRYSLEAGSPEVARLVRINPKSGEVTVNDKIDREQFSLINVTVKAEDFGQPHSLAGSCQLLITVRDENDNNPIFLNATTARGPRAPVALGGPSPPLHDHELWNHNMVSGASANQSYRLRSLGPPLGLEMVAVTEASATSSQWLDELAERLPLLAPGAVARVREDAQVGQQLAFVRAEDADVGNNGRVTYLLDGASSGGKFRIERDSGVISLAQPLDREQQRHYALIIEACDNYDLGYSTGESRRAFTQVQVQVTDVNDNVPQVAVVAAPAGGLKRTGGPAPASGGATTAEHHQTLGYPTLDEAMNSPGPHEMPLADCHFIDEFQPLNEPILTLAALDADDPETPNGQVDLAIVNNLPQSDLFRLVPVVSSSTRPGPGAVVLPGADLSGFGEPLLVGETSGSTRRWLQRRSVVSESSLLEPSSAAAGNFYSPSSRAHSLASIVGAHASDFRPLTGRPDQFGGPFESPAAASSVDQASSTTTIASATSQASEQDHHHHQRQQQAVVVVAQSLKERVGNYTILVRATDRGQPALSSVKLINICVQDVNNHAPVFMRPPLNHTIRIMENATLGSFVVQVEAQDSDHGLNGELQYSLKPTNIQNGNNDWQSFKINRLSGVITTARLFNRQLKKYYTLRVQAQDFGRPAALSSDIDINIMIVNSGKYQPEFESQQQQVVFTENVAPGVEWFTLLQTTNLDDDPALINAPGSGQSLAGGAAGANWLASPCYYIIDGDDYEQVFQLDRYTHRLTNRREIDREQRSNFTLLVQASNNCNRQLPAPSSGLAAAAAAPADGGDSGAGAEQDSSPVNLVGSISSRLSRRSPPDWPQNRTGAPSRGSKSMVAKTFPVAEPSAEAVRQPFNAANLDSLLAADKSLLRVSIRVKDVNDNAPKFTQRIYTGGITTEADFGTVFMIVQALDPDAEANGQVTYRIVKPIKRNLMLASGKQPGSGGPALSSWPAPSQAPGGRVQRPSRRRKRSEVGSERPQSDVTTTLRPQLQFPYAANTLNEAYNEAGSNVGESSQQNDLIGGNGAGDDANDDLFVVNPQTGEISLNFDPQKHMKGYFEFEIVANDTEGLSDTARVLIYLLRQDQRVKFVLRLTPQELRQRLNKFRSVMGNITGAIVNIDSYKYHENHDGTVDKKRTSLYLHFVNPVDNTIIEVDKVLTLIDNNIEYLDELYKEFHVLSSEAAHLQLSSGALVDPIDQVRTGLMGVSSFLALILVLVIALCLNQRTRYERQLKAATVSAFGGSPLHLDPDFHSQGNLPNTNLHSQDPNPIWVNGYGGQSAAEQEHWPLGAAGLKRPSSGLAGLLDEGQPGHKHRQRRQTGNRQRTVSIENAAADDDDNDGLSSSSQSDLNSLGGINSVGQLHYNVATTATPRDSLNSSHGQPSSASSSGSASGAGSASTTNERQALCGKQPAAALSASQQQSPGLPMQSSQQGRQLPLRGLNRAGGEPKKRSQLVEATPAGSSTFGAFKEVTIFTDRQQQQQQGQALRVQQPAGGKTNNLIRTVSGQQQVAGQVNKLASQFQEAGKPKPPAPPAQQSIYITGTNQQTGPKQRILVHANGVDVSQGIIKGHLSGTKPAGQLNAKFVPASQDVGQQQEQQRVNRDGAVREFETSLSKLSILNLETTEL